MGRYGEASPGSLPVLDRAGRRTINSPSPGMGSRSVARRIRGLALAVLLPSIVVLACQPRPQRDRSRSGKDAPESDATDAFVAKRPDFPIKIGVYSFASSVHVLRPIQPYDRAAVRATLASLPRPGGGTAIGDA